MSISVQEVAARQTEKIARDLILAVEATPIERLTWRDFNPAPDVFDFTALQRRARVSSNAR